MLISYEEDMTAVITGKPGDDGMERLPTEEEKYTSWQDSYLT